ncbi:MAG: geranylgeranyl reductase family protein [Actinomycetota bacterium]|nr:geranylgeranyl reductase family protein [Actinomycetota bacterium]
MIHKPFDAVVVGAGPGGATAAYHLARRGYHTLVVDKAKFPREKVCGDGLTPRAVRVLQNMGVETDGPGWARAEGLRIVGAGVTLDLPWPDLATFPGYGLVRTRLDFDALVLDRARAAGATVWEETEVTKALVINGVVSGVEVKREDGSTELVKALVTIASDGAASRMGLSLGGRRLERRPMGVAVRAYYRSPRYKETYLESYLELWHGAELLPGYGWIFPLPDGTVNVGLGLLNTSPHFQNVDYKRLLRDWLAGFPADWELVPDNQIGKVRGGPLPMGFNRMPLARPGLMLVGDAAGVVNPFNGEGIAYAMETGAMAAEIGAIAIDAGDPWKLRLYPDRLKEAYEGYFVLGRAFVRAIGHAPVMGALTKYGLPNRRLMQFAFKVLGNLTDPRDGDAEDRLFNALCRMAPTLRRMVG